MKNKALADRGFSHLGLPPMTLAECKENNKQRTDILVYKVARKICIFLVLFTIFGGAFLFMSKFLDNIETFRTTEILVVTSVSENSNLSQTNGEEISLQLENDPLPAMHSFSNRIKRDIDNSMESTEETIAKFKDVDYKKAREVILNHNVLCNEENKNEMCKNIVMKLKSITEEKHRDKHKTKEIMPKSSTDFYRNRNMEVTKRDAFVIPDIERFYESRDGYVPSYPHEQYPPWIPYADPHPNQGVAHPHTDNCLLARLQKEHHAHPQGGYGVRPEYIYHQPYGPYPVQERHHYYRTPQEQDDEPIRRPPHPQDIEIFMKFLTPKPDVPTTNKPTNSSARDAQCPEGSVPCNNGESCVTESQWCNGQVDCSDVSDEANCNCKSRVDKYRLCDGYYDCPFGEDEMGCYGCSENAFSCEDLDVNSKSSCFTKEQRCNNIMDCPNNRDEIDCNMLSPSLLRKPLFAISNTEGFLQRNFRGDWYAVCQNPYMWAHDVCRRETGLIIRPPYIQVIPVDPLLRVKYLNTGPGGSLHTSDMCYNSSAIYVTCPQLLCGTRILSTSQLLKENAAIENHLYGRNKRFLLNSPTSYDYLEPLTVFTEEFPRFKRKISKKQSAELRKKRAQSRVVGGRPSKPAAFPWVAAMYRNGMFHCGGVIVTQQWVLSAAHCVHEFWKHYYEIQVGMLRRFSFSPQEQNHLITHIIVNHKYDQKDMKNDLSLLRVETSIQFSRWVRPICLPNPSTAGQDWMWGPAPGTMCTAVGWGATVEHGPDPDHMRDVELPIWANCKHSEDQQGKEICAGLMEGGKDACQGDSGGPLLCRNPMDSQQWYVAGIVSHGDGCARKGEPGVYTRVSLFVKWIKYNIGSKTLPTIQPLQKCPGFKCSTGIMKCLSDKRVCDRIIDCLNGEDEMNCSPMRSFESIFSSRTSEVKSNETSSSTPTITTIPTSEEDDNNNKNTLQTFDSSSSNEDKDNNKNTLQTSDSSSSNEDKEDKKESKERSDAIIADNHNNDFKHASTMELSISKSEESARATSEESITDPNIINDNTLESSDQDQNNFFTMTSSKESLESRSSVLESSQKKSDMDDDQVARASDIEENWSGLDLSTTTTSSTADNTPSTDPTTLTALGSSTHTSPSETSTVSQMNSNSKTEEETLKVELLDLPKNNTEDEKDTGLNEQSQNRGFPETKSPTVPTNTITSFEDRLDEIHKIEDIVLSELQPAKIRKKHLTPKEFECRRIFQEIPYSHRCDHKADCEDGTDELACTCVDYLFSFDKSLLCDGAFDCADGQDEIDCFSCPEDRFLCSKSQICLPKKYVCDGKPQCPQGEDEFDCLALTNGKEIGFDFNERPKTLLEGYVTRKVGNQWHVVCEDNLSTQQQEEVATHICHYLGFSSANRYRLKHLNLNEEVQKSINDGRLKRDIRPGAPVHFTYRESNDNRNSRNVVIKEPQVLKESCVPNVTKTCMTLYVYCDSSLFNNFELSPNILFGRNADSSIEHMWPWIAKIFVEGTYKCTGILVDDNLVLVAHTCLWDSLISHHHITAVLGSHRTLNSTCGPYEQVFIVDGKKDLYRSNVILLHLNGSAQYSAMVKPMAIQSTIIPEEKPSMCVAVGQDENNKTVSVVVEETRENCYSHNKCYNVKDDTKLCPPKMVSSRQWSGIISCHTEQGWYPAASFVDSRGECGPLGHIIGTNIENLKLEIKHAGKVGAITYKSMELTDKCNGVRCGRGMCVNMRNVCNGIRECEDGNDESELSCEKKHHLCKKHPHNKECECSIDQFRCHNGRCIPKEMFNDGNDDCDDRTDEPDESTCSKYLARVMPSGLCDGILHCKDKSDEDPMFCKCFAKRTYPCGKLTDDVEHCVAPDMVCDGVADCPNGEDEQTCFGLSAPKGTPYGKGQVMVRSHGVWHSKCYSSPNHTKSELESICRELGFISGHAKELDTSDNLTPHPHNNVVLDPFSDVILNNKTRIKLRNAREPLARPIFDETLKNCYPVFIECL